MELRRQFSDTVDAAGRIRVSRTTLTLAGVAAALAAMAVYNTRHARRVERENPPTGRFITVDGVRLHYIEAGEGPPVVLLHGNVVTALDFVLSGVLDLVAERHRVIAFDRPGYGHSERPRGRAWTPRRQAELLLRAFERLGIDRPIVVGHSWGTLVALALALARPDAVRGLVLLSGYYYPTVRLDLPLAAPPAIPILGDLMRYTVSPLFGRAFLPLLIKGMFSPLPVARRFAAGFPYGFSTRPWQIRPEAREGTVMVPAVAAMRRRYGGLRVPVVLMAGTKDRIADFEAHTVRFHEEVPRSDLRLVPGAGHMVHYAVPEQVADAIEAAASHRAAAAVLVRGHPATPRSR